MGETKRVTGSQVVLRGANWSCEWQRSRQEALLKRGLNRRHVAVKEVGGGVTGQEPCLRTTD